MRGKKLLGCASAVKREGEMLGESDSLRAGFVRVEYR